MPVSPEMQIKIADWRIRAREGTLSLDEMREAISFLRGERLAMPAAAKPGTKRKATTPDADDLLSELGL